MTDVRLERLEAAPLAVVRRRGAPSEIPSIVPAACGLVWDALKAQGLRGGRLVAIYLDGAINMEIGVELDGTLTEQGEVARSATPAGLAATATWFGPYSGLGAANLAIKEWAAANGYRLLGPSWEVYGHWQPEWNADPSLIRTDVYWLVEAAG